jgi:RNA polymerase sigma-70 factor, ECF subfamily
MTSTETDSVVARVLGGEIDAYEAVVRAYQQVVWKVVAATLFNAERTEDLVQQTFINAYQHLHHYQRGRHFGVWLKEIARNQVRQELRSRAREDRRLEVYHTHLLQIYDAPATAAAEASMEEALRHCTQKLPPSSAKVIELRYQSGLTFGEIAAHVGRTLEATRQHLARIRISLRECIEKHLAKI